MYKKEDPEYLVIRNSGRKPQLALCS